MSDKGQQGFGTAFNHIQAGGKATRDAWRQATGPQIKTGSAGVDAVAQEGEEETKPTHWLEQFQAGDQRVLVQVSNGQVHTFGLSQADLNALDWELL